MTFFSHYEDAQDFLSKTGLDPDAAIKFLDAEINKLKKAKGQEEK